jgi:hypothetical protein
MNLTCGECGRSLVVDSSALQTTCPCGKVFIVGKISKPLTVMCGNCARTFDVNREAKSAKCSCGTVHLIGQVVKPEAPRSIPTAEAASSSSSPLAAFEHYRYCVGIVNEIGRRHGANSREMDEVWPVMVEALGRAVGAFKAWEFQGKITAGSDLAKKYSVLLKESERILAR